MILKLVSLIWIGVGIFGILKPSFFKNWMKKKAIKRFRKLFFFLAIIVGLYLLRIGIHFSGFWPKVIIFIGILSIIKGTLLLKETTTLNIIQYFSRLPLYVFRILAVVFTSVGFILFSLR